MSLILEVMSKNLMNLGIVINHSKQVFEPFGDLIKVWILRANLLTNQDSYAAQENDKVLDQVVDSMNKTIKMLYS